MAGLTLLAALSNAGAAEQPTAVDSQAVRVSCQTTNYVMQPGQVHQAVMLTDPAHEQVVLFDLVEGGAMVSLKYGGIEHIWGYHGGALLQMAFHHSSTVGKMVGDYNPTQAGDGTAMSPVTGIACHGTSSIDILTLMLDFNHNNAFYRHPVTAVWGGRVNSGIPLSYFTPYTLETRASWVKNGSGGGPKYYLRLDERLTHLTKEKIGSFMYDFADYGPWDFDVRAISPQGCPCKTSDIGGIAGGWYTDESRNVGLAVAMPAGTGTAGARGQQIYESQVGIDWVHASGTLKTVPSLQVVSNRLLRPGSPIFDSAFQALKRLQADDVRFVPWFPYPKLAVPELEPPANGTTSWDFSLIDPMVVAFFEATRGHPVILNFSTEPAWMFRHKEPTRYPSNPDEVDWTYSSSADTELTDPTGRQLAAYDARIFSWYSRGGFTDEYGHYHRSGHHFPIPYWEVLNEPDGEHAFTAKRYTTVYDAVVEAIGKVDPRTKFVALALADADAPDYAHFFQYFLDPRNHRPGTPLDMISVHFYAVPGPAESLAQWPYTFFDQANSFLGRVRFIDALRGELSPATRIIADELGSILYRDNSSTSPAPIPAAYWNLSGALYAYVYMGLSKIGVDVVNESQLVGYPSNFPEVSMVNWKDGKPNARYWVLSLLREQLAAGEELCDADVTGGSPDAPDIVVQGYRSAEGARKILIVNMKGSPVRVKLDASAEGGRVEVVDESTGEGPPRVSALNSRTLALAPFAVAIVDFR